MRYLVSPRFQIYQVLSRSSRQPINHDELRRVENIEEEHPKYTNEDERKEMFNRVKTKSRTGTSESVGQKAEEETEPRCKGRREAAVTG